MSKSEDIASWRAATPQEVIAFYNPKQSSKKSTRSGLIVRSQLRPVDVYAYLLARFGQPNGLQNQLRRDDSDNWIHWDFNLIAGDVSIHIAGTSRDVHFWVGEKMTDQAWKELIVKLKGDFARIGHAKSSVMRSFEKFVVFQNKFVALTALCAEMHDAITSCPAHTVALPKSVNARSSRRYAADVKRLGKRANRLYGDCLKLRLLTPIMAEAFIQMVILILCKDDVRKDRARYNALIRSNIPERLQSLYESCDGFLRPIDQTSIIYSDFKRVMDRRNFAVHGNVDPRREQLETVYFDGKRPLFATGGDNILEFFNHLEEINKPSEVIADYEAVHLFLIDILDHLSSQYRSFIDQVIYDPYPGFEVHKNRVTRILPSHSMRALMPRVRYDDELNAAWK